jgi:hypothetical protein
MDRGKNILAAGLTLATLVAAAPAHAQYYPEQRRDRVADEIRRGGQVAAEVAGALGEAVRGTSDAIRGASYAFRSPAERFAADACGVRAEQYGRVTIDRIDPYKRRSWRVSGVADPMAGRYADRRGYGYDRGYDRGYSYDRRYQPRSFTCTVRYDGRVTKFSTRRLRY